MLVYVGDSISPTPTGGEGDSGEYPVTMAFRNERYDRALNSVRCHQGCKVGWMETLCWWVLLFRRKVLGRRCPKYSNESVDVKSASQYLGNLGAVMNSPSKVGSDSSVTGYGSGYGPLIGLTGTTDLRLNTITLVGEPKLINVAQNYLKQIDLRKRQVAVKVQILNVTLDNDKNVDSSFSAKIGDTFIVSASGKAHMNFGAYKPGSAEGGAGVYSGDGYQTPGTYDRDVELVEKKRFFPPYVEAKQTKQTGIDKETGAPIFTDVPLYDSEGRPVYWPDPNPNANWQEKALVDSQTGKKIYEKEPYSAKRMTYPENSFYSYIESVIVSSSAKALAQPTLLVQEGEKATVRSGESVITGVSKSEGSNGSIQFSNTREDAGLTVDLEVEKIDDNGFVTLKLDPTISVPVSAGSQEGVQIFNVVKRELRSGRIRLRDRQTLILTGVIQESDRQLAQKWPILGDLPFIGQLFRSSSSNRQKNELVVIVTPSILNDENGASYGYGYLPSTPAGREFIKTGS